MNQPVNLSLPRELAAKIGFANVPTNEPYFKLPDFVQLRGTLGKLEPKVDKTRLAGLAAVGIGSALQKYVGDKTGQQIGGVLNALGSNSAANPPPPQPAAPMPRPPTTLPSPCWICSASAGSRRPPRPRRDRHRSGSLDFPHQSAWLSARFPNTPAHG